MAAVLDLPTEKRADFLAREPDAEILSEVEKLLAAHENADGFIDKPILVQQGAVEDSEKDSFIGRQIENYLISEKIGVGGMGAVYLAERLNSDFKQKVALKIIRRGMDSDAILKRFATERRILSTLKHPNIAPLLDGGISSEGLPFFVMEFVEGLPLNQFCAEKNLDLEARLKIFRQICSAVDYAHKNLIVHRDLKPSNVIVTEDGTPKLLDFGIAKVLENEDSETTVTMTREKIFTPEYASPEQITGKNVTTATDVYSLGVILYEILSGHRPFETRGKSFDEIVKSICETEPPKPSDAVTNFKDARTADKSENPQSAIRNMQSLRGDLDNIVLKALRKEPSERYGSVQQFSEDISRFLGGLPILARPQTVKYRFGKYVKRHRAGVFAAALVLLSLVGGISVATWQAIVARRERARAEQRFNEVRKIAKTVLFEYYEKIKEMPGATEVSEKMVTDSLEYLDNLANGSDYSIDLQREIAVAYRKVGDIQAGGKSVNNLGQSQAALKSYQKALAIQEKIVAENSSTTQDHQLLGNLMINVAATQESTGDLTGSESYSRNAVELFRRLAGEMPAETKPRSDLARAMWTFANCIRATGDLDKALQTFRQSAEIFEQLTAENPEDRRSSRNAALTYKNMGAVYELQGNFAAALELYRKALPIDAKNAEDEPNNVTAQMDLSFTYGSIATASVNSKDNETALENSLKKLVIQEKVVASDAKNAFARSSLGSSYQKMGFIWKRLGKLETAAAQYKKSIEIFKQLRAAEPGNITYQRNLAYSLGSLGDNFGQSGNFALSAENFRGAISIYKELGAKNSDYALYNTNFAEVLSGYAKVLLKSGKAADALENNREALKLLESRPAKDQPPEILAAICEGIADALILLKEKAEYVQEAKEKYRKSLEIRQRLRQNGKFDAENSGKISEISIKLAKL